MLTFLAALAALQLVALAVLVALSRRRGLRRKLRRTLIVHTSDERSIRGVLLHEHADCVVLVQGWLLDADTSIAGDVVILRENISWAQDITGTAAAVPAEEPAETFTMPRGARP